MVSKREAKRIADEDTTPYAVFWRTKKGDGAGMATVTGYRNAKIFQGTAGGVILTASEIKRVREGWRPL
jgi:hypothetical protein